MAGSPASARDACFGNYRLRRTAPSTNPNWVNAILRDRVRHTVFGKGKAQKDKKEGVVVFSLTLCAFELWALSHFVPSWLCEHQFEALRKVVMEGGRMAFSLAMSRIPSSRTTPDKGGAVRLPCSLLSGIGKREKLVFFLGREV